MATVIPEAYGGGMTAKKFTISVPEEIDAAIRQAAEAEGLPVSAWIAQAAAKAADERTRLAEGRAAVAEFEAEYGPIPAEARERARRRLAELGDAGDDQRMAG